MPDASRIDLHFGSPTRAIAALSRSRNSTVEAETNADAERKFPLPGVECESKIFQRNRSVHAGLEPLEQRTRQLDPAGAVGSAQKDRLGVPIGHQTRRVGIGGTGVLFEHGMSVDSRETKRVDAGPARVIGLTVNPRSGPGAKRKGRVRFGEQGMGVVAALARGKNPVVQR